MLVKVTPEVFSFFSQIVNDHHKQYFTGTQKDGTKYAYDLDWHGNVEPAYVIRDSLSLKPEYYIDDNYVAYIGYRFFDEKVVVSGRETHVSTDNDNAVAVASEPATDTDTDSTDDDTTTDDDSLTDSTTEENSE